MVIEHKGTGAVSTGTTGAAQSFAIHSSAHAFRILSAGLYMDRIQAIVRELSCNALDSHVMAGKRDTPFVIHLPNSWQPYFSVQDFGTGLDDAGIRGLYCTYFSSSKSQSNDQIGSFGLGSKSPFAYTEGFTVESIYDGIRRTYTAAINEEGMPEVNLMDESPVEDGTSNGIKVQFPVEQNDIIEFRNKAAIALEFITPAPIVNITDFKANKQEYVLQTDTWGIRKVAATSQTSAVRAIQGMVAYNVGKFDVSRMNEAQQRLMELPIDLFFPIGELSVAPSRETLTNDKRTTDNMLKRIVEVNQDMLDEMKLKIDGCATLWEARMEMMKFENSPVGPVVKAGIKAGEFYGQYTNFILTDKKIVVNQFDFPELQITKFAYNSNARVYANKQFKFKRTRQEREAAIKQMGMNLLSLSELDMVVDVDTSAAYILNDLKGNTGGEKYLHHMVQNDRANSSIRNAYVFTPLDKDTKIDDFLAQVKLFMDSIGNPKLLLLSEIQKTYAFLDIKTAGVSKATGERRTGVVLYGGSGNSFWNRWKKLEPTAIPDEKTVKFYFLLDDYKPMGFNFYSGSDMVDFVTRLRKATQFGLGFGVPIYGLKKKSKLQNDADWVEIGSHIKSTLATLMTPAKQKLMTLVLRPSSYPNSVSLEEVWRSIAEDKHFPACAAKTFADAFIPAYDVERATGMDEFLHIARRFSDDWTAIPTADLPDYATIYVKNIEVIYPMLRHSRSGGDTRRIVKDTKDYIRGIEKMAAIQKEEDEKAALAASFLSFTAPASTVAPATI